MENFQKKNSTSFLPEHEDTTLPSHNNMLNTGFPCLPLKKGTNFTRAGLDNHITQGDVCHKSTSPARPVKLQEEAGQRKPHLGGNRHDIGGYSAGKKLGGTRGYKARSKWRTLGIGSVTWRARSQRKKGQLFLWRWIVRGHLSSGTSSPVRLNLASSLPPPSSPPRLRIKERGKTRPYPGRDNGQAHLADKSHCIKGPFLFLAPIAFRTFLLLFYIPNSSPPCRGYRTAVIATIRFIGESLHERVAPFLGMERISWWLL